MPGISIQLDAGDLTAGLAKLKPIFDFEPVELMTTLGALGESQTRRRITEEKTAPDGTPWEPNREGKSILLQTGQHLLASVAWTASAEMAEWGASWEHAHVHQDGMTIVPKEAESLVFQLGGKTVFAKSVTVPARPFVGLSDENVREIVDVVTDHFQVLK
ncbi:MULTISPECIES: phage virion morphogenesis protein [unclassified Ensifer]|uniref:phage virion morphogenesis protein n=1 Tax=unclassified Ensifer TaxID=2633371 RepID=UPI0008133D7E|nr:MULTISPECIES: phage virion morphogenesis protein [unclassified Ensifer]OCP17438.1 phage morphogenesis protein [Ensifer sp. LC54]OCP28656.1 phage morphogenesis protein [Ensifer sp. LC384]